MTVPTGYPFLARWSRSAGAEVTIVSTVPAAQARLRIPTVSE